MRKVRLEKDDPSLNITYLLNMYDKELPNGLADYATPEGCSGVNVSATHVTKEIIDQVQADGKKLGLYINNQ